MANKSSLGFTYLAVSDSCIQINDGALRTQNEQTIPLDIDKHLICHSFNFIHIPYCL